jgi:hypothetical protein
MFTFSRSSTKGIRKEGNARPVNVVLNEMEIIRQKDREEKLNRRERLFNKTDDQFTTSTSSEKQKGRGKNVHKRRVVKWKFLHDAKIPRILTKEAYLKTLPAMSTNHWDFSSDESLERNLNQVVRFRS